MADKQLAKKGKSGVDNTFRRTWDKDDFTDKAAKREKEEKDIEESALDIKKRRRLERDPLHQGLIVERAKLKPRGYQLDLSSRLGKTQVVTNSTPLNQQAGYYCNVCDCILRDSQSYLDHINGKYHNRALGMSMTVEKSTADDVRKKFEALKKDKDEPAPVDTVLDGWDRKVLEAQEEEDRERQRKKDRKRERQREENVEEEYEVDDEMALALGFGGFGSSKR